MWFAALILSLLCLALATSSTTNLTTLINNHYNKVFCPKRRKPPSPPTIPFPLLSLPPELRLQIYKHTLPKNQTIILTKPSAAYCPFPPSSSPLSIYLPAIFEKLHNGCPCQSQLTPPFLPLLQSCRIIRKEALECFYARNAFVLNIDVPRTLLRIPELLDLFEKAGVLDKIKDFRIRVGGNVMVDVCGPEARWKKYGARVLVARVPSDEITGLLRSEENIKGCVEKVLEERSKEGLSGELIRRVLDEVFWNWEGGG